MKDAFSAFVSVAPEFVTTSMAKRLFTRTTALSLFKCTRVDTLNFSPLLSPSTNV